jgi:thiamine-monophosphate kinase
MNLRQLGEDHLLQQLLPSLPTGKGVVKGPGHDCAIVEFVGSRELLVLKTDCVVEKIHFEADANAEAIGWKAMMRPLSDFAAVSAVPQFALITLIVAANRSATWVQRMYDGLNAAAREFRVKIVGGETSSTNGPAAISVSIAGKVEKNRWVSRDGGKVGDDLFVTGRLGLSRAGKHLRFMPRIEESRWLTQHLSIHAMMDLSDGIGADLPRLARASKVGFKIDEQSLPRNRHATVENAISDGEDYELLFAISPRDRFRLECHWRKKFPKIRLTRIGSFTQLSKNAGPARTNYQPLSRGYVHFK